MGDAYRYYEILGLTPDASPADITRAYRILVETYHPDVSSHPKAQENFERVHEAYAVLSDVKIKAEYDAYRDNINRHPLPEEGEEKGDVRFAHEYDFQKFDFQNKRATDGKQHFGINPHHTTTSDEGCIGYGGESIEHDRNSLPHTSGEERGIPKHQTGMPGYAEIIQKITINISIFLIIAIAVFYGISVMKASPNDNISPGYLAPALSGDTLLSQKDTWARQIKEAMDSENPTTRDYALSLIDKSHAGERNIAQICDIWEKTYRKWTYVSDPKGFEYFSPASNTINIGLKGDCDDFAILIASLVESTSGSARVILAQGADGGGHAYAEVYVTDNEQDFDSIAQYITKRYNCRSVAYHVEYDDDAIPSYWLNLDWQSGRPGGDFYDSNGILTTYHSNGYWHTLVSGV